MKPRKFLEYGVLSSAPLLANFVMINSQLSPGLLSSTMKGKQYYDWIILYWMPYDNNLSRHGVPIFKMLARGVQTDNILVAVQADIWGAKNLSRRIITKGKVEVQQLVTANSASVEVFAEYLSWAHSQFTAKKWAVVILGHGGRLDEISPDENPGRGLIGTQWMNIKKMSDAIQNFNRAIDNRVDLLFFQICNKGTLEIHYTFKDAAKYTLSSQKILGAPNYYYELVLHFLGRNPEVHGGQLAEKIMEFERSDMYESYTVTDNQYICQLPAQLNPLIDAIINSPGQEFRLKNLPIYSYLNEFFIDVLKWFNLLSQESENTQELYTNFLHFFKQFMIYRYQVNPIRGISELSGLGLFLPRSNQDLEKYRYLPVFSDLKLFELFEAILFIT